MIKLVKLGVVRLYNDTKFEVQQKLLLISLRNSLHAFPSQNKFLTNIDIWIALNNFNNCHELCDE